MRVYLERSDGPQHRFYEVRVQDESLILRWGRIGTKGREHPHHFTSQCAATEEAIRKLADKLAKGYRVAIEGATAPKPPTFRCAWTLDMWGR